VWAVWATNLPTPLKKNMDKKNNLEEVLVEEETLCGNPHNNGDNDWRNCTECGVIKLNV